MTVSNQATKTLTSLGDGSTVDFTIGFSFQSSDDVHVYLQDESSSPFVATEVDAGPGADQFTVTGTDPGTTVHMGTAPSSTQRLLIKRIMAFTQSVDYVETDAFPAESHEQAMDKQVLLLQQVNEGLSRALKFSDTSSFTDVEISDPDAGKVLVWNDDATAVISGPDVSDLDNLTEAAAAAEASAAQAADDAATSATNAAAAVASATSAAASAAAAQNAGLTVIGSYGGAVAVNGTDGIVPANYRRQMMYVVGASAAIDLTSLNPQIGPGYQDGDQLALVGTNNINTIKLSSGNGIYINSDVTLSDKTVMKLIWLDGAALWIEDTRNDL